jgi:DNA replication and repair protein RecF
LRGHVREPVDLSRQRRVWRSGRDAEHADRGAASREKEAEGGIAPMSMTDHGLWVERIALKNFRNYSSATLETDGVPVVLLGANGAGKTNILEAVSLLSAGQGLRRAVYSELARASGDGTWAVAARVHAIGGAIEIGTGIQSSAAQSRPPASRILRLNGETQSGTGILADLVEMVWLIPAMDGLFTGPASERRRFLDRLILCFDPAYRTIAGRFERAMQSRNRLLADGVRDAAQFAGLERIMAETGVAVAAARAEAATAMAEIIAARRIRDPLSPFPWATIAIEGVLESSLAEKPAIDVEDDYVRTLANARDRDRAAGRTLDGPHRSDLVVAHGPKQMAAKLCSTGEQKALLLGLVLAHAELVAARQNGVAPILLLDEITAHLDEDRRAALFVEILRLKAQAWMTGTDLASFAALAGHARFFRVDEGSVAART